jgi:hypothetical protein
MTKLIATLESAIIDFWKDGSVRAELACADMLNRLDLTMRIADSREQMLCYKQCSV